MRMNRARCPPSRPTAPAGGVEPSDLPVGSREGDCTRNQFPGDWSDRPRPPRSGVAPGAASMADARMEDSVKDARPKWAAAHGSFSPARGMVLLSDNGEGRRKWSRAPGE